MKKILYIFIIFIWFSISVSLAQSKSELKEFFIKAESHFLYGEYEKANEIFIVLSSGFHIINIFLILIFKISIDLGIKMKTTTS